ncbi:MAG: PAS domain S-box protein [Thermodesulfobacteriota bacterium]
MAMEWSHKPPVGNPGMTDSQQASRFAAFFEAAVDAVIVIGEDRRIQAFSKAAERLFGYTADEVAGKNVSMLMPEPHRSRHDAYVTRYIDTGEKHIIGTGREVLCRRKDGATFPAYLSVGEGGEGERFFVGILHDLSREKDQFRRIRELASIVDSTGDAVLGQTLDGIVTYWNKGAEELYGYTAAEAVGSRVAGLIVPEEKLAEYAAINEAMRSGQGVTRIETLRRDKAGKRLIVALTISPILDSDGNVTGASGIARDITSRRMAEKAQAEARRAAEEATRIKSDFLSIVSHELRTPMTIILGNISLLTDTGNMPGPEEAASIARDIEDSANRLLALINDLLDISDMEAGQAQLRLTPVQAAEMILELAQAAEAMAEPKGLKVDAYFDTVEIMADPLRLKQALLNLVDNAVKFTDSGTVTIGVSRTGHSVLFEVSDTGAGISDEDQARIFDAFFQADTSFTRTSQGTGLGLTIVRRIVELHGGVVNVESEPGKGSTFYIALPLRPSPQDTPNGRAPS